MGHARESITVIIRTRTRIPLVSDCDDEDERRGARSGARRPARVGRRSRGRRGVMVPSEGRTSGQEELCCHTMTFETIYSLRLLPPVSPMGSIA